MSNIHIQLQIVDIKHVCDAQIHAWFTQAYTSLLMPCTHMHVIDVWVPFKLCYTLAWCTQGTRSAVAKGNTVNAEGKIVGNTHNTTEGCFVPVWKLLFFLNVGTRTGFQQRKRRCLWTELSEQCAYDSDITKYISMENQVAGSGVLTKAEHPSSFFEEFITLLCTYLQNCETVAVLTSSIQNS